MKIAECELDEQIRNDKNLTSCKKVTWKKAPNKILLILFLSFYIFQNSEEKSSVSNYDSMLHYSYEGPPISSERWKPDFEDLAYEGLRKIERKDQISFD